MKAIYKRMIGLLLAIPGLGLLYLSYSNKAFDVTIEQIVIFITGALISTIITVLFFWGMWLFIYGPED